MSRIVPRIRPAERRRERERERPSVAIVCVHGAGWMDGRFGSIQLPDRFMFADHSFSWVHLLAVPPGGGPVGVE